MTRVGITGAAGFFGWHLRCRLHTFGWEFVGADRATFADPASLDEFVNNVDVVVHLAGVNRALSGDEIVSGNVSLAEDLIAARARTGSRFDVVYANSIKADEPDAYGESKAAAGDLLGSDAREVGSRFVDIRFPHLFGEFGVPFYNSGVTTFAHQLARNEASKVNEGELELLHIQDASQLVMDAISKGLDEPLRPDGRRVSVPECYSIMRRLATPYVSGGTFPEIRNDEFELRLFNTIRSQMWPDAYPMKLVRHTDHRGAFFETVRAFGQGQTSISTTVPGVTRGEHYHLEKVERFAVVAGQAQIRVRRLLTDDLHVFNVTGAEPVVVDMPPLCTHDITNTGDADLATLFWSHDHFDPSQADTFPEPVVSRER